MTRKITRINQIAKERPEEVFTSIYHLINKELLKVCFNELDDNKTNQDKYRYHLNKNLNKLVEKLKNKSYKPSPIKNKKDQSSENENLEDKIVQLALKKIIEAIYEPKFSNNMFGFRKNKNWSDALKKITIDIEGHSTNYVVEIKIKEYFDNINHEKLIEYLKLYIKDSNILRLVKKFLKVGVIEKDTFYINKNGIPQGSMLKSILANIYMYYTIIKWFEDFIKIKYDGFISIINYENNLICCFQYESVAELFYKKLLPKKLKQANLELVSDKTRIISFGRFAIENCKSGKPNTFEFLGFTHYCSKDQNGKFCIKRKTSSKNFTKHLVDFNRWCKYNKDLPLEEIMSAVKKKLIKHYNYYGITDNYYMIQKFYDRSMRILFKWLNRRSQKKSYTWREFLQMISQYSIPKPYIRNIITTK